jgi:5-methylcytosine-specific restriction endonuclease McrA
MSKKRAPNTAARQPWAMTKRAPIKSSVDDIVDYWTRRECESGLSVDWAEAHERCWRCSRKTRLEKCHIIPDALDGADSPNNLIPLCARCHREAPNVSDPTFTWIWLRRYAVTFYDADWIVRGYEEFERIFRRKPFAAPSEDAPEQLIVEALKKYRNRAIIHFGEGRPNPATVAWLLSKIESELGGQSTDTK